MNFTVITAICMAMFVLSCTSSQPHEEQHGHHHAQDHAPGKANTYMHQASVDELVQRFESPERDAYQQPQKVLEYLGELNGKKVMDLGAGSGYFTVKLARAGAQVIAADVDEEFQAYIRERIQQEQLDSLGIELRKIPYDDPQLASQEVDMVLIVNTYHHIEDRIPYFSKVRAGIQEGGELVIIDYFKKELPAGPPIDHKIAATAVMEELAQAGFSQMELNEDLLAYQYLIRAKP